MQNFKLQNIQTPKININFNPYNSSVSNMNMPSQNYSNGNINFNTMPQAKTIQLQQTQTPQLSPAFNTGN
jgi:hypothetical protein